MSSTTLLMFGVMRVLEVALDLGRDQLGRQLVELTGLDLGPLEQRVRLLGVGLHVAERLLEDLLHGARDLGRAALALVRPFSPFLKVPAFAIRVTNLNAMARGHDLLDAGGDAALSVSDYALVPLLEKEVSHNDRSARTCRPS
jgi:hypothetical protein